LVLASRVVPPHPTLNCYLGPFSGRKPSSSPLPLCMWALRLPPSLALHLSLAFISETPSTAFFPLPAPSQTSFSSPGVSCPFYFDPPSSPSFLFPCPPPTGNSHFFFPPYEQNLPLKVQPICVSQNKFFDLPPLWLEWFSQHLPPPRGFPARRPYLPLKIPFPLPPPRFYVLGILPQAFHVFCQTWIPQVLSHSF